MEFNKELSAIHAYLCADGYVIKNPPEQKNKYYYIGFRNFENKLLEDFEECFFKQFKIKPRRCKDGRTVIQKKEIYKELTKEHNYYSKDWTYPKLNEENVRIWLRAYFDCEGHVHSRKHIDRHIELDSINEKGIKYVQKSLLRLKIESKIKKLNKNDKNEIFRLIIYGKENLKLYQEKICFLHPKKKEKLKEAINSYTNHEWDFSNKKELIKKLLKNNKSKRIRINSIKKENITKLSKILNKLKIHHTIQKNNNEHSKYSTIAIHKTEDQEKLRNYAK